MDPVQLLDIQGSIDFEFGGKLYEVLSRGVWGHTPQEKFENLGPLRLRQSKR